MMKTDINRFLDTLGRSPKTIFAYRNALEQFVKVVGEDAELNTEMYSKFLISLKQKSASTQRMYTTAVLKLYAFCKAGNWAELKEATAYYRRRSGKRIVNFDRDAIGQLIDWCSRLNGDLLALRDRAFVLTLADTGFCVSPAGAPKTRGVDLGGARA